MRRWGLRAALTLLVALLAAPAGAAAQSDGAATLTYVRADLHLVQVAARHLFLGEEAIQRVLDQVRRECPNAAGAYSPQDPESTQLSNEAIGTMVTAAIHPALPEIHEFLAATSRLHWSRRSLNSEIHSYVSRLRTMASLSEPHLCADVRAWAASGFHNLPASTVTFDAKFMPSWVALGELPEGLARYENGEARALAHRAEARELELTEFEANSGVTTWGNIMNAMVLSP
jgi:hypothetical protein